LDNAVDLAVTVMQWQAIKLHARMCPAEVAAYQTACMNARCCHAAVAEFQTGKYHIISLYHFFDDIDIFNRESLQSSKGIHLALLLLQVCLSFTH
jgi:hypothetical protein